LDVHFRDLHYDRGRAQADEGDQVADLRRSPTVRRRRLGIELRKLREAAGKTAQQVTKELEWSPGKLTRLEKAQAVKPMVVDTRLLLDLYGVPSEDPRREELLTLTRQARQSGWWSSYKDVLDDSFVEFEAGAEKIRTFQLATVPGLLQTPAYAAAINRGALIRDPAELDRLVQFRMERQRILAHDDPPSVWAVIDEAALLRRFGTVADQREQVQRLIETAPLEHVTVQVLPVETGPHPGLSGSFVILDFPEADPSLVYMETQHNSLYLEGREEINRYSLIFQHLSASALSPDATTAYLGELVDRLK
jgi:transcriptional regulator with XRE-family HTH domain